MLTAHLNDDAHRTRDITPLNIIAYRADLPQHAASSALARAGLPRGLRALYWRPAAPGVAYIRVLARAVTPRRGTAWRPSKHRLALPRARAARARVRRRCRLISFRLRQRNSAGRPTAAIPWLISIRPW